MKYTVLGWNYQHVHEYLEWSRPRLAFIRDNGMEDDRAAEWLRDWRKSLHTRINLKAMLPVARFSKYNYRVGERRLAWRKLDSDWQISARRDSRRARDAAKHIRVYAFETKEANAHLSHLLTRRDDF